jgi:hypothetical protein
MLPSVAGPVGSRLPADEARGFLPGVPSGRSFPWNNTDRQQHVPKERLNGHLRRPKMMQVHVERDAGDVDAEKLKRFRLDGRCVEVIENIDRWFGPDYAYFKVRGDDGNLYILRLDEARDAWELTMFKSPQAETFASVPVAGRPYGDGKQ